MTPQKHQAYAKRIAEIYQDNETDYDDRVDELEKIHDEYLKEFEQYLKKQKLSPKVIARHIDNVNFYITEYLPREMISTIYDGGDELQGFFGYFYIHKCLFASVEGMKRFFASLNKFYRFLYQKGYVTAAQCANVRDTIHTFKDEWMAELRDYDEGLDYDTGDDPGWF